MVEVEIKAIRLCVCLSHTQCGGLYSHPSRHTHIHTFHIFFWSNAMSNDVQICVNFIEIAISNLCIRTRVRREKSENVRDGEINSLKNEKKPHFTCSPPPHTSATHTINI